MSSLPSTILKSPSPAPVLKETTYILYYRQGNSVHTDWKVFPFNGNLRDAIARAQEHCNKLRLRFLKVRPFHINLDDEEKAFIRVEE